MWRSFELHPLIVDSQSSFVEACSGVVANRADQRAIGRVDDRRTPPPHSLTSKQTVSEKSHSQFSMMYRPWRLLMH